MLLTGKRIFMVEDNRSNSSVMRLLLDWQGAESCVDGWGGDDTIRRLQDFAPVDIILLDLMLPNNITGYDVFDHIRAISDYDLVPIIAVSAMDASVAVPKAKAKGFAGFITKPINYDLFPRQLVDILDGKEIWSAILSSGSS